MIIKKLIFNILAIFAVFPLLQAQPRIDRVEPPNWWVGMKNHSLQILLYGNELSKLKPDINYRGVKIDSVGSVPNNNYLFLYITIGDEAISGSFTINLLQNRKTVLSVPYELNERRNGSALRSGFDQRDVVCLVMPDRFANGDILNDSHPEMIETANRANPDGRHGGDLKGVENHLDYFSDLGVTALWLNPFVENNMPSYSYHGYAITDFYKTDVRLGTNQGFVDLVAKAHSRGLKMIMDMVFNHCGINHWFIKDLPSPDWIHQFASYTRSSFKSPVVMDPYASQFDKHLMLDGWFDKGMPDLNQKNPHLAVYLTQNSIWWVEYANLDGIRVDTHMYPDPGFVAQWRNMVRAEYPNLNVVGELWIENKALHAYWMKDAHNFDGYNSNLEYLTDFPMFADIRHALNETTGWERGAERIYYCLAQDIVYKHPENNLIFLTNHDVSQFYTLVGEDYGKFRLGITLLLTLRGIPQLYQGMEILMTGDQAQGHGPMRKDFPGGWASDTVNAFSGVGLTALQKEAHNYVKTIANWRKECEAAQTGRLMQFVPDHDVYVYFRYTDKQKIMVVLNFSRDTRIVNTARYSEMLNGYRSGKEIITGENVSNLNQLTISGLSSMIIQLDK